MTILIIEGSDLSGKSTAIDIIGKHFNSGFTLKNHYKPRKKEDSNEIYAQYERLTLMINTYHDIYPKQLIILDRFFPSQAVYSIFRKEDEMYWTQVIKLDIRASIGNYIFILLDTPLEILAKRYREIGDEYINANQLKKIKERYDQFYKFTRMKKYRLNTLEKDWLEKLVRFINAN